MLATDLVTLHKGAQVCKTWNRVVDSCNVRSICVWARDGLVYADTVIDVLNEYAGPACLELICKTDALEEDVRPIFADVLP